MVWNDYFDLEQDKRERPFRPIASGKVTPRRAAFIGAGLMAGGLLFAFFADQVRQEGVGWTLPLAMGLVVAIFLYDGWLKRTWAGPISMGACRSLNVQLGLSAAAHWTGFWGLALAMSVGVYIVGVTWFARTEARDSNRNSLIGATLVIACGFLLALAVPVLADDVDYSRQTSPWFPYLLATFGMFLAIPLTRAIQNPLPQRVQAAVKRAVLGLIVFDAVLATSLAGLWGLSLIVLLIPAMLLGRWVYST